MPCDYKASDAFCAKDPMQNERVMHLDNIVIVEDTAGYATANHRCVVKFGTSIAKLRRLSHDSKVIKAMIGLGYITKHTSLETAKQFIWYYDEQFDESMPKRPLFACYMQHVKN